MTTNTIHMFEISKAWTDETIAQLLNKDLTMACRGPVREGALRIERLDSDPTCALLTFSSETELQTIVRCYGSIVVPLTHGYHHFSFGRTRLWHDADDDGTAQDDDSPLDDAPCLDPPLHLQLMALSTAELERRLDQRRHRYDEKLGNDINDRESTTPTKEKSRQMKHCKVHRHAALARDLVTSLNGSRAVTEVAGVPISPRFAEPLLAYLRTTDLWPPKSKQRRGVNSSNYLTIRRNHPKIMNDLWDLCQSLIRSVFPAVRYTALAITRNFRGSPHIDKHDTTYQHVVALGDFSGGKLCADDNDKTISVDVHNKLGRIDGRHVHWVSAFRGERYSVVYYSTDEDHCTDPVDQCVHNDWMRELQQKALFQ